MKSEHFKCWLTTAAAALGLAAAAAAQPAPPTGMRVHFIDVGQGAATLIELPKGSILVDTGGEEPPGFDGVDALDRYLRAFFDRRTDLQSRLDLLVITHPHPDHFRGIKGGFFGGYGPVLATYRPRNVVHNGDQPVAKWIERYVKNTGGVGVATVSLADVDPDEGLTSTVIDPFDHDGVADPTVRVLWGRMDNRTGWCNEDFYNENNESVVVRIDYGGASLLVTGDLEEHDRYAKTCKATDRAGIERLVERYASGKELLDVDVYQVGHHGSYNGTSAALVEAMTPHVAVIAAGPPHFRGDHSAGSYGHPREVTIRELEAGVDLCRPKKEVGYYRSRKLQITSEVERAIFSTGWDGTVVLHGAPNGFWTAESPAGALGKCPPV